MLLIALVLTVALAMPSDLVCNGCSSTCSLYSTDSFPCYEGAPNDAVRCYNTDPLIPAGTVWSCDTCASHGYTVYLRQDPVYTKMALWSVAASNETKVKSQSDTCQGCTSVCSFYSSKRFPCYQGVPEDTINCYNKDPLVPKDSVWTCDTCANVGYGKYLRQDPVFTNMGLWSSTSETN